MNSTFEQIQSLELLDKEKSLALFHINACSINKNFDGLDYLLKCTNETFDVITVSETKITAKASLTCNINLNNYFMNQSQQNLQGVESSLIYQIVCHINHVLTLMCIRKIS